MAERIADFPVGNPLQAAGRSGFMRSKLTSRTRRARDYPPLAALFSFDLERVDGIEPSQRGLEGLRSTLDLPAMIGSGRRFRPCMRYIPTSNGEDEMVTFSMKDGHITPELQIDDIRINLLEVAQLSIVESDELRVISGAYNDGGTFEVTIPRSGGKFNATQNNCLTNVAESDDKSSTVISFLPKKRHVKRGMH